MRRFAAALMSCFWNARESRVIRRQIGSSRSARFARATRARNLHSRPGREASPRGLVLRSTAFVVRDYERTKLLLHGLNRLRPDLLALNLRSVPPASECLHQKNRRDHLLAKQLGREPLIGEQSGLRGNDVEVSRHSANVAAVGDIERAPRIFNRCLLSFRGAVEDRKGREAAIGKHTSELQSPP